MQTYAMIRRAFILWIIVLGLCVVSFGKGWAALSNMYVLNNPTTAGATASYTMDFTVELDHIPNSSSKNMRFSVKFPNGTNVPSSITTGTVTVNDKNPNSIATYPGADSLVVFITRGTLGGGLAAGSAANLSFSSSAGIQNTDLAGSHQTVVIAVSHQHGGSYINEESGTYGGLLVTSGTSVTAANVTLSDYTVNAPSSYTFSFDTGSISGGGQMKAANQDYFTVVFPTETIVPSNIDTSHVTINGQNAQGITTIPSTRSVEIVVPVDIGPDTSVSMVFSQAAGLVNPSASGDKTLSVSSNIEPTATVSNNYTLQSSSTLTAANVISSPSTVEATAGYTITFNVGDSSALTANTDTVTMVFPEDTALPSFIDTNNVQINSTDAYAVISTPGTRTMEIITPVDVADNGSVEIVFAPAVGIVNPASSGTYTLQIYTNREPTSVTSNTYPITASTVTAATVTPSPLQQSQAVQYTIELNVGSQGVLTAGSSTITIVFPNDTVVPSSMAANEVQVNYTFLSVAPTTDPGTRTVTFTTPVSVPDNGSVTVLFSESAGLVNPTSPGEYTLIIHTSVETTQVTSNSYSISSTTTISTPVYTSTDYSSGTVAEDTVSFNINMDLQGHNQQSQADYIQVQFPEGTTVPGSVATTDIRLESADGSKSHVPGIVAVAGRTITAYLAHNDNLTTADNPVRIRFLTGAGIGNPSTAKSSCWVKANTRQEPTLIISEPYIIISTTPLAPATVTPSPNTTNTQASYTINFATGSNGALAVGDTVTVQFPYGTTVPSSISKAYSKVNSVECEVNPVVSAGNRRVRVISPVTVSESSAVNLSFTLDAGIINPSMAGTSYRLDDLHTTIQPIPNATASNAYSVVIDTDISPVNVTPAPNTVNTTAQYTIAFTTGDGGLAIGDTIVAIFPSDTVVPASITASNATVNSVSAIEVFTNPGTRKVEVISNTIVGSNTPVALVLKPAAGIVNPTIASNVYTLQARTTADPILVTSNIYNITRSTVTAADVTVNPSKIDSLAQYTISFNAGTGGALTADSTITITFPSGAVLGSAVQNTPGNTTVNGTAASSVSVSGQQITVTVPSGVNIPNNGSVTVIFADATDMITNPSTPGTNYQVTVKTSAEPTPVASNTYAIFETTTVTPATVTPNPISSGDLSQYTIAFNVGDSGALTAGSDIINVTFPSGTVPGSAVQNTPGNTTVNGTAASSVSVSGQRVTVNVPSGVNIPDNGPVTVVFANASNMITNPSTAGSNKTVAVSTSQEPNSITSNTYTITSSSTSVSVANVSVDPDTVAQTASYTIEFNVGSNGTLILGDQITVAFPSPTIVPGSIAAGAIQINSTSCTTTPQINGDTVTLYTPVSVNASGSVSVVFLSGASIVNPSSGIDSGYTLNVNTNIEASPITSNIYVIYGEDESLPVELAHFEALGRNERIVLKWRTESEIYNSHWMIERKAEYEKIYRPIGTLKGQGNKSTCTEYTYADSTVTKDVLYYYRISDVSFDGVVTYHGPVSAIAEREPLPEEFSLDQNYPNPFNIQTTIPYAVPVESWVKIEIYNMLGQLVRTLIDEKRKQGYYSAIWDGADNRGDLAASGTYFCLITAGPGSEITFRDCGKILVLK